MENLDELLSKAFVCSRCHRCGAKVERLAMSGTGLSRLLEIQTHRYAFVSCIHCGYTDVYNLEALAGKDEVGAVAEALFAD